MEGTEIPRIPDFKLSEQVFVLANPNAIADANRPQKQQQIAASVLAAVTENNLGPYYKHISEELPAFFPFDAQLHAQLNAANEEQIAELKQTLKEVEDEDKGEMETLNGWIKLGNYYAEIGDKANAVATLKKAQELAPSTGIKIDILLTITRVGFFFNDYPFVLSHLNEIKLLSEKGGDWERRNRYKTYLGLYHLATRNFGEATSLLIDSLATFTSSELIDYDQLAQFAIIAGLLSLDRPELKKKIIDSPEILAIYSSALHLEPLISLTNALYISEYPVFFRLLMDTNDTLVLPSKYLFHHSNFLLREIRVKAYSQLLESYKSLSLNSMAQQFSVSVAFLDEDLCKFIPNKKLNCVIDKVNGIVITNRPDNKNNQYQALIKNGDQLLTKLQKYGAAVKLSGAERI
ncbi:hypothetical protein BABINDRAFT_31349 [Babjeviella inositovora NRRL Y-12698]|uniref:PCI domain-containing protein n=1 Tax=Babjeviella inositovora NRRL Y-12698 TaxID=984486 RepID=A0A1E3R066_9ASCO|nr:uncharacterized protein BABINDRAFT_31349 [Babjeviella inositovora NRRL Y-12698]ODQ82767.1 hypothetical protein BABINDRAFT_31349 [Babjeviella inositovora NRRL Y-12698]